MNLLYSGSLYLSELAMSYVVTPLQTAWKQRWPSDADFDQAFCEIPEIFRFFQHCSKHKIFDANIKPSSIRRGDTVFTSGPRERCSSLYLESASPLLQAHFKVAEGILDYVQKKVPHSPNYSARSFEPADPSHQEVSCDDMEKRALSARMEISSNFRIYWKAGLELAESIEEAGVGYCEDMAHVGKLFAWRKYPDVAVELVQIKNGRHTFLIIGRDPDSDPLDYRTWGENCLVCDLWTGRYYPASAIETELYDYLYCLKDLVPGSKITYPYVRRFDPKSQNLICEDLVAPEVKQAILAGQDIPASNLYG